MTWKRIQKKKLKQGIEIFIITIEDIEKALTSKQRTNLNNKLLNHYREFLGLFNPKEADKLPSLRLNIDYKIKLINKDSKGHKLEIL